MSRKVEVEILGDSRSLERSWKRGAESSVGFAGAIGKLSLSFGQLAKSVVFVELIDKAIEGVTETVHAGIEEFRENAAIQAQTQAALASTGNVAHTSAKQIDELGLSLSNLSGVNDEVVRQGANTLLTFTNIRNFAGKGNQIFNQALKETLNFSVRSGRGIQAAGVAIGRALQDPAKAASSLRRAYVVLTADEKRAIASALAHGDVLKAQRDIIADLEKRYGGAAKAAGQTLPGELNVLRDRFHDLAGEIVNVFAPSFSRGIAGLTDFVRDLSTAKTARARIHIIFEGIENLDRKLINELKSIFDRIDWDQVLPRARVIGGQIINGLRDRVDQIDFHAIAARVGDKLRSINWSAVIGRTGRAVGDALVATLNTISRALNAVDWSKVGKVIVDGIGIAIAAVVKFLASVNWKKVAEALARTFAAALRAAWSIVTGAATELGRRVIGAVSDGVRSAGHGLEELAIRIALKVIEPFTHIPTKILGHGFTNVAQVAKKALEGLLKDLEASGSDGGEKVGKAISDGITTGFSRNFETVKETTGSLIDQQLTAAAAQAAAAAAAASGPTTLPPPPAATPPRRKGITAAQRNTFFDNALTRLLDRVQDIPTLQGQLAKLKQIASLITERIGVTRDVTRRLTLEDDLLNVIRQEKQTRVQITQGLLDALQLNLDRAGLTKSVQDDLDALLALKKGIERQIRAGGDVVALEQQLVGVLGQIRQVREQQRQTAIDARNARQFKALGFTGTGDDVIPGVAGLRRQLKTVDQAIQGTFLDTKKTTSLISHIRQVLSGGLGAVGRDVRDKVKQILDGLDQQLKDHAGDQTKFRHISTANLLAGLGLSPEQLRVARIRLAQVGPGATAPAAQPAFGLAGGGGLTINGGLHLHGVQNIRQLEDELEKRARSRAAIRRGA